MNRQHKLINLSKSLGISLFIVFLGSALILPNSVLAQGTKGKKSRIAVLEFNGIAASKAEVASATDQLRDDLIKQKAFTVLDRGQIDAVLGELAFQQKGVTDSKQAVEVGKLLNVEYIVTGRMTRLTGAYQLNVQIIEVKTARVADSQTLRLRGDILKLLDNMSPLAAKLTAAVVDGKPSMLAKKPARVEKKAEISEPEPEPEFDATARAPLMGVHGNPFPATNKILELGLAGFTRDVDLKLTIIYIDGNPTETYTDTSYINIDRTTFYFGFPAGKNGIFRLGFGTVDIEGEDYLFYPDDHIYEGSEFMGEYRMAVGKGGKKQGTFVASFISGIIDNDIWEGSYGQLDIGGGISLSTSDKVTLYVGGVLSSLVGEVVVKPDVFINDDTVTLEFEGSNTLGFIGGMSFKMGKSARLGLELHAGHESGFMMAFGMGL